MKKEIIRSFAVILVFGWLAMPLPADEIDPTNITLQFENATAAFDITSSAGMKDWCVNDIDHLHRQWFWFRVGDTGGEQPVDSLVSPDVPPYLLSDTNGDDDDDKLLVRYTDDDFIIDLEYLMVGTSSSDTSTINETVTIENLTSDTLHFHLFQYCDFDLNNSSTDSEVLITGGNTTRQYDTEGLYSSECAAIDLPNHYEVGYYSDILDKLDDSDPTTLDDIAGPLYDDGNLTWAFQWDLDIGPESTEQISKVKHIIPEPTTVGLLVAGGVSLLLRRRWRA